MKNIIWILFLSACSAIVTLPPQKTQPGNLIGWWERYYPEGHESGGGWNLSHIEFMENRTCRYTMGKYEGEEYITGTYNDMKWEPDSLSAGVFIYSPYDANPYFHISLIELNKSYLTGRLSIATDTLFMKKLPKLH